MVKSPHPGGGTFQPTKDTGNLFPGNGTVETLPDERLFWLHPTRRRPGSGVIVPEKSYDGKNSCRIIPNDYALLRFSLPAESSANYLFSFRIYGSESIGDGTTVGYAVFPGKNGMNQQWHMLPGKKINFNQGKPAYIDVAPTLQNERINHKKIFTGQQ